MAAKDVKSTSTGRPTIYACVGQSAVAQKGITLAYPEHSNTTSLRQPLLKFRRPQAMLQGTGAKEAVGFRTSLCISDRLLLSHSCSVALNQYC